MAPEEIEKKFAEIENRLNALDSRVDTLEQHISSSLDNFGDYKNRNEQELQLMKGQIESMINSIESLISAAEYQQSNERAKGLLRRLRNNQTRIAKQLKANKA
ncbi:hypothetical protein [Pseudomonas indica]|uniref:Uncharacterized protein n=1 Tax=Pseudomonas indica TaxID=137658 RepID=A0A1G9FMP2_9PSED|nr:hypothetical protein [Pseudomonas indica]SDK89453.1 hypothetical protein SAMN05216186_111167 [Pseudomonas indica]